METIILTIQYQTEHDDVFCDDNHNLCLSTPGGWTSTRENKSESDHVDYFGDENQDQSEHHVHDSVLGW